MSCANKQKHCPLCHATRTQNCPFIHTPLACQRYAQVHKYIYTQIAVFITFSCIDKLYMPYKKKKSWKVETSDDKHAYVSCQIHIDCHRPGLGKKLMTSGNIERASKCQINKSIKPRERQRHDDYQVSQTGVESPLINSVVNALWPKEATFVCSLVHFCLKSTSQSM